MFFDYGVDFYPNFQIYWLNYKAKSTVSIPLAPFVKSIYKLRVFVTGTNLSDDASNSKYLRFVFSDLRNPNRVLKN